MALALQQAEQQAASRQQLDALAEQARRQALLGRAAAALSGSLDLGQVLDTTARLLTEALHADRAGVIVLAEDTLQPVGAVSLPASGNPAGPAANALIERLKQAGGFTSLQALAAEQPVPPEQTAWVGGGVAAAVFGPLVYQGQVVGLAGAGQAPAGRVFSAAEIGLAHELGRYAAAAAHAARQATATQQQLSEQTIVDQILRAVGRAGDLQQLVDILRARLGSWVPSDGLALTVFDQARQEMTVPLWLEAGQARDRAPFTPGGLLRHVLQTRRPLRLGGELLAQARELGLPLSPSANRPLRWTSDPADVLTADAYLGAPILSGDQALGVLSVEASGRPQAFDERHERLLAAIADQVALVMDSRRLFEQTSQALAAAQARVTQLEALAAALSVIASALYSEDVVGVTLEQFERAIPYDRAAFWRREAGAGALRELRWRAAAARGYPESSDQLTQAVVADSRQLALFAELVSTRRVMVVPDTAQDARFDPLPAHPARSWLGVPLVNKGEVIGLLIAEQAAPNAYHASHAASAQILANQITAVLTNTYQYEESVQRVLALDERSRRLAFLNRFTAELGGNLNLGSILQLTLKALAESLGVDQATAAVFDETRTAVLALAHYPEIRGARQLALPGSSLIERFQEAPAPITLEDLAGPEAPARLRQADWIGPEVRAAMFLPLLSDGKLIGVIGLGQSQAAGALCPARPSSAWGWPTWPPSPLKMRACMTAPSNAWPNRPASTRSPAPSAGIWSRARCSAICASSWRPGSAPMTCSWRPTMRAAMRSVFRWPRPAARASAWRRARPAAWCGICSSSSSRSG